MKYTVSKEKGGRYFVCREGREDTPLSDYYTEKKKALKEAARMSDISFKDYMKCYRRECRDDSADEL